MTPKSRYYLFRAGNLIGPVSAQKIDNLRRSKEISQYSWIMDEEHQRWAPVDEMPHENPFQATLSHLKERTLSGALLNRNQTFSGIIQGIHSFGLELLIAGKKTFSVALQSAHLLNLIDETNLKSTNAEVIYQGQEKTADGLLLRFTWRDSPSTL